MGRVDALGHLLGDEDGRQGVMSLCAITMPPVDDLTSLRSSATAFADEHAMTVVPAVPHTTSGPKVCLEPDVLELSGLLNMARQLGVRALYVQAETFDPDPDEFSKAPAQLLAHRGKVYHVEVAFVADGVVHSWERIAAWYDEWEDFVDPPGDDLYDVSERLSDADRERLAAPAVEALLAMPEFRAAKVGARQRFAQSHLPANLDGRVGWDVVQAACDRADELSRQRYADIDDDRYDELAERLLTDQAFQRAGSASGRKQAAERFLTAWADGFPPTSLIRDELHARAQRLSRAATRQPGLY